MKNIVEAKSLVGVKVLDRRKVLLESKSVEVEVENLELGKHCWDGRSGGLVRAEDNIRAGGLVGQEVVLGKRSCWD